MELANLAYLGSPEEMGFNYEISTGETNSSFSVCYLTILNPDKKVD